MDPDEARAALTAAARERDAAQTSLANAREHLYGVIRATVGALTQAEVARLTGYDRERIRQLTPRPSRHDADSGP